MIVVIQVIAAIVAFGFFLYGCYWVAKTVSYSIFYEDMVKATITEMTNEECLKPKKD